MKAPIREYNFIIVILVLLVCFNANAQIEGTYEVAIKKQEEKKQSRWSLGDWLAQKQKNHLMDLWLAANSHSSPYEFFIGGQGTSYSSTLSTASTQSTRYTGASGDVAAYAGVFGLRGGYGTDSENRTLTYGSLNLRLLGRSLQDTHINLEFGIRGQAINTNTTPENFQCQYGGGSLDLYLTKYFGLEGMYRKILPGTSNQGRTLQGEDETAGVFLDFNILRVFGNWTNQFLQYSGGTQVNSTESNQGFNSGIRLYF